MASKDLKKQLFRGTFWSFCEIIGQQGGQFFISIILARLLMPEEFGLIAMLTIFITVAQTFIDSGFGTALIQKRNANQTDESTIFYFNLLVSFIAATILALSAPWIAKFFNVPTLELLTRVLSLNLIISGFGVIQTALLTKAIKFKILMKISLIAMLVSGVIGVGMAYDGFGVWSLVAQSISGNVLRTFFLWIYNSWRPKWVFSFSSLRSMFTFGSNILFTSLISTIYDNIYTIVIGKMFSFTDLGYYIRARSIERMPVNNIKATITRVTYPVFASVQEDSMRMKIGLQKILTSIALLNFPLMIGLALISKPLVFVLLTEKWLPCVFYLQLLCIAGMPNPLHAINLNIIKATGRSALFFRLEAFQKFIAVIALLVTIKWGISVMIMGQIFTSLLCYFINGYYAGNILGYPIGQQVKDITPIFIISCLMGVIVYSLILIPVLNQLLLLISQIIVGIISYILLCKICRISAYKEITKILGTRYPILQKII